MYASHKREMQAKVARRGVSQISSPVVQSPFARERVISSDRDIVKVVSPVSSVFDTRILAKVIAATGQVACLPEAPITAATRFAEDLGMDSLDVTEVVLAIEETFDTEIAPDLAAGFVRVGDFARYLSRRYSADAAELALAGAY